jgi:hypothetical protein
MLRQSPNFLPKVVPLTNSMRLSSPKGARAALSNAALQEIWVEPIRRLRGIPAKRKVGFRPLISPCYSAGALKAKPKDKFAAS